MFPTPVRQPAPGKQRETEWPSQSTTYLAEWHRSSRLSWSPVRAWNSRSGCTARGAHMLIASPHTPELAHQRAGPQRSKPDVEVGCTKHQYNLVFLPTLTFSRPAPGVEACLSEGWWFPGVDIAPTARWQGDGIASSQTETQLVPSTNLVPPLIRSALLAWGRWDGAKGGVDTTLRPCHHPQHPASFPWEQPALANKSSWRSSKAILMGVYPKHWDINNLINTENT